jgi:hypothetical protein
MYVLRGHYKLFQSLKLCISLSFVVIKYLLKYHLYVALLVVLFIVNNTKH